MSSDLIIPANTPGIPGLAFRHFQGDGDFPAMAFVLEESEKADGIDRPQPACAKNGRYD